MGNKQVNEAEEKVLKTEALNFVFFGTCGAGKSSICNQLRFYNGAQSAYDVNFYRGVFFDNFIGFTRKAAEYFENHQIELENSNNMKSVKKIETYCKKVRFIPFQGQGSLIISMYFKHFCNFWNDSIVKKNMDELIRLLSESYHSYKKIVQIMLSYEKEFENVMKQNKIIIEKNENLDEKNQIPLITENDAGDCIVEEFKLTISDVLLCRRKTTGIFDFSIRFQQDDKIQYAKITETGGNRSENKKWVHIENPNFIFYVVSLADFDTICYEDEETPKWKESLTIFQKYLEKYPKLTWVLIFTNVDVFEYRIKKYGDMKKYLNDYEGNPYDIQASMNHYINKYQTIAKSIKKIQLPFLPVNSLNMDDIHKIQNIMKQVMFRRQSKSQDVEEEDPSKSDKKMIGKYELLDCLGKGSFGNVYLARIEDGNESYALKVIAYQQDNELEGIEKEIEILQKLKHEKIISLHAHFHEKTSYSNVLGLVMPVYSGGDLRRYLTVNKNLMTEGEMYEISTQILEGICYCHSQNVMHRDLKPENIFFNNKESLEITIADFGFAKQLKEDFTKSFLGTPMFMSPELVEGKEYSYPSDIWAIGVILYCIFARSQKTVNFRSKVQRNLVSKNLEKQQYQFKKEIISLIENCLELDPKKRYNAEKILEKLNTLKKNLKKETKAQVTETLKSEEDQSFIEGVKIIKDEVD